MHPKLVLEVQKYVQEQKLQEALDICNTALSDNNGDPLALRLAGTILNTGGNYASACNVLKMSSTIYETELSFVYSQLALIEYTHLQYIRAIAFMEKAIELNPKDDTFYSLLGVLYCTINNMHKCRKTFRKGLSVFPDSILLHKNFVSCLHVGGNYTLANKAFKKLKELKVNPLEFINHEISVPPVMESEEQIHRERARVEKVLKAAMQLTEITTNPVGLIKNPPFYFAYHGCNDKELLKLHADTFYKLAPILSYQAPHIGTPKTDTKIKIGFFSNFLWSHPVGNFFNLFIRELAQDKDNEVYVYLQRFKGDNKFKELQDCGIKVIQLPEQLHLVHQTIAENALDVLIYPDVGMDSTPYFTAFARLARIQMAMTGHPNTTGIKNIDYFVSVKGMEPENAQEHYTEKLIELSNPPVMFAKPDIKPFTQTRKDFELPEDKNIYTCPMTIQKFHPKFDYVMKDILSLDPDGVLVLFNDFKQNTMTKHLKKRMKKVFGDMYDRIIWKNWYKKDSFYEFINLCDVVLDPIYFGGGTTLYDICPIGTPIITLEGEFMRGRMASWVYKKIKVTSCIAINIENYIAKAVIFGRVKEYNDKIKNQIKNSSSILYDDTSSAKEFNTLLKDMIVAQVEG